MDPASALAVACNAFELTGMAIKFGRKAVELYQSGRLAKDDEQLLKDAEVIESTANHVQTRLSTLQSLTLSQEQLRLQRAGNDAIEASHQLQSLLNDLARGSRKRDIIRKLAKRPFKSEEIDKAQAKLERCHRILDTECIASLSAKVDVNDAHQRKTLYEMDRNISSLGQTTSLHLKSVITLLAELRLSDQRVHEDLNKIERKASHRRRQDRLIHGLSFKGFMSRENQISLPHSGTCKWIFGDGNVGKRFGRQETYNGFTAWLSDRSASIFWIKGKAGSGKSTLMKHIADSPELRKNLESWCAPQSPLILTHFFWRAGNSEQASLCGMLRTLLLQTFELHGHHIATSDHPHVPENPYFEWSFSMLMSTFNSVINKVLETTWLFILIDGVDEFVGSYRERRELFKLFKDISARHNAKICVSSRPEQYLVDTFEVYPHLDLQKFTFWDMENYVDGELSNSKAFSRMKFDECDKYDEYGRHGTDRFTSNLVRKAQGVFQWLHFAVEDIINGLEQRDDLDDLFKRLDTLPPSLDGYYERFLEQIPRVRLRDAATMISMTIWNQQSPEATFSLLDIALVLLPDLGTALMSSTRRSNDVFARLTDFARTTVPLYSAGFLECIATDYNVTYYIELGREVSVAIPVPRCSWKMYFQTDVNECICADYTALGSTENILQRTMIHFDRMSTEFHHRGVMDFFEHNEKGVAFLQCHGPQIVSTELIVDVLCRRLDILVSTLCDKLQLGVQSGLIVGNPPKYHIDLEDIDTLIGHYSFQRLLTELLNTVNFLYFDAKHQGNHLTFFTQVQNALIRMLAQTREKINRMHAVVDEQNKANEENAVKVTTATLDSLCLQADLKDIKELDEAFRCGKGMVVATDMFRTVFERIDPWQEQLGILYVHLMTEEQQSQHFLSWLLRLNSNDFWQRTELITIFLTCSNMRSKQTLDRCTEFIFCVLDEHEELRNDFYILTSGERSFSPPIKVWVSPLVYFEEETVQLRSPYKEAMLHKLRSLGFERRAKTQQHYVCDEKKEWRTLDCSLLTAEEDLERARACIRDRIRLENDKVHFEPFNELYARQPQKPRPTRQRLHQLPSEPPDYESDSD